jgi:hypothetical protein
VTAYQLTPVGADGPEPERAQRIETLSYQEIAVQNELLRRDLETARVDVEVWHRAWATAVNNRVADRERLSRAARVLASLGRLSPRMADVVEAARREIWRLDGGA